MFLTSIVSTTPIRNDRWQVNGLGVVGFPVSSGIAFKWNHISLNMSYCNEAR